MEGVDAKLLAAGSDVLGSQHGGVGGGLVAIGLDLHSTGNTADGLTATGITQVSPGTTKSLSRPAVPYSRVDEPEIGDVDEGVVEGGEDTGNAEDELACAKQKSVTLPFRLQNVEFGVAHTIADGGAQGDVLLGSTDDLLGGHFEFGDFGLLSQLAVENEVHQNGFPRCRRFGGGRGGL